MTPPISPWSTCDRKSLDNRESLSRQTAMPSVVSHGITDQPPSASHSLPRKMDTRIAAGHVVARSGESFPMQAHR